MSKTQFETELKEWQAKLLSLYSEGQQLFLRHGAVDHVAPTKIMPHLEQAKNETAKVLNPETPPTE